MEAFPTSKVILTVRDPEAWYQSVNETIKAGNDDAISFPVNILDAMLGITPVNDMVQNLCRREKNRLNQGMYSPTVGQKISDKN